MNEFIIETQQVGSRIICNPPVLNTDEDWIVLTNDLIGFTNALINNGFVNENKYNHPEFTSFRRNEINLIVTDDKIFYKKFLIVTEMAKTLNLLKKQDRINFYNTVLKEYQWEV